MNEKTENEIKKEMQKYESEDFELYIAESGWESWMEEYTDSAEGEECSETELKEIENIQKLLWDEVHP
jgi:hypothetical protein